MSSFGTVLHAIASLKNNKLLRKGHAYLNPQKTFHRKIVKKSTIETFKRSPEELEKLKNRYQNRYQSVKKKQILLLIGVLVLATVILIWTIL